MSAPRKEHGDQLEDCSLEAALAYFWLLAVIDFEEASTNLRPDIMKQRLGPAITVHARKWVESRPTNVAFCCRVYRRAAPTVNGNVEVVRAVTVMIKS